MMSALDKVLDKSNQRSYKKGQIVLYQGEVSNNVFKIVSGFIKVYDLTPKGTEKLLMILGEGDFFPILWSTRRTKPLHYFYETYSDCELQVVAKNTLIDLAKTDIDVSFSLLDYYVRRSSELMTRIECIESTSAKHKVMQVLDYLAFAHGKKVKDGYYQILPAVTHSDISNMAGITRETASLQLKEIENQGIVKVKDNLIVNFEKLQQNLTTDQE